MQGVGPPCPSRAGFCGIAVPTVQVALTSCIVNSWLEYEVKKQKSGRKMGWQGEILCVKAAWAGLGWQQCWGEGRGCPRLWVPQPGCWNIPSQFVLPRGAREDSGFSALPGMTSSSPGLLSPSRRDESRARTGPGPSPAPPSHSQPGPDP